MQQPNLYLPGFFYIMLIDRRGNFLLDNEDASEICHKRNHYVNILRLLTTIFIFIFKIPYVKH